MGSRHAGPREGLDAIGDGVIVAQQLEIIRARLGLTTDQWLVTSADKVAAHAATGFALPRYAWVPTQDAFDAPERAGVSRASGQRQLLTRVAGLELHLWAETQDDAETRLNDVIVAWLNEANTSVAFQKANWHAESTIGRGVLLTLNMRVKVPILDRARRTARATKIAADTSGSTPDDGWLDCGES